VAAVNGPAISGHRSACSGLIRNFAVMKIIVPPWTNAGRVPVILARYSPVQVSSACERPAAVKML
jgi:hypothetical protein